MTLLIGPLRNRFDRSQILCVCSQPGKGGDGRAGPFFFALSKGNAPQGERLLHLRVQHGARGHARCWCGYLSQKGRNQRRTMSETGSFCDELLPHKYSSDAHTGQVLNVSTEQR
jgi:hypothetical protein